MNEQVKIETVDKNFTISNETDKNIIWIDPCKSSVVSIYGFNWFDEDKRYHRLPKESDEVVKNLEGNVAALASNTSGGMLAFYTNSKVLKIRVKLASMFHMGHMAYTGQAGFDLYRGKNFKNLKFYRASNFDFSKSEYEFTFYDLPEKQMDALHVLNFPLYASVEEILIGIDEDANIQPELKLFPNSGKIVFYGTSITQGGCASRPGMSYTNIVSRHLGYECLNFGFSGNGKGHSEIAEILANINQVKAYVINYEANVNFEDLKRTLPAFIDRIRKRYIEVPIIIMSKIKMYKEIHSKVEEKAEKSIRDFQKSFVKTRSKEDKNIYYVDGRLLLGNDEDEKTVDGVHPTDYGFASIANVVERTIRKYVKK